MHPDLVRPAGAQLHFHQREAVRPCQHAPVGVRLTALGTPGGHASAPAEIARNGQPDRACVVLEVPVHQGDVGLLHAPRAELLGEFPVRRIVPRHHQRS